MSYYKVASYTTSSITAYDTVTFSVPILNKNININKIKIVPSVAAGPQTISIHRKSTALLQDMVYSTIPYTGDLIDPIENVGGVLTERNNGFIAPFENLDGTNLIFVKIYNGHSAAKTYQIDITYSIVDDTVFNVKEFGAKGDGTTNDAAAIMLAFAAMGVKPTGRLIIPQGVYRISSTLDFNLGYTNIPTVLNPTSGGFELDMEGSLKPDSGIGAALYVHGGYYSHLTVKIDGGGGGTWDGVKFTDQALKVMELSNPTISLDCKDYAGTAFFATTQIYAGSGSAVMSDITKLQAVNCGQCFCLDGSGGGGFGGNGFGLINQAFDSKSVKRSVIRYMGDVTITHFENDSVADTVTTFLVEHSASINMGTIAMGGSLTAPDIMTVGPFCDRCYADKITVLGFAPYAWSGPATTIAQNGLVVTGSTDLAIATFQARQINGYGMINYGSRVKVSNFLADTTLTHYLQAKDVPNGVDGSTADLNVKTFNSKNHSFDVAADVGVGHLTLSGHNRFSNIGGTATYNIWLRSTTAWLNLTDFLDDEALSAVSASVNVLSDNLLVSPTTRLIYLIHKNGVALTTTQATFCGPLMYLNNSLVISSGADAIPRIYGKPGTGAIIFGSSGGTGTVGQLAFRNNPVDDVDLFNIGTDGTIFARNVLPQANDTYFLGRNSIVVPLAYKGLVLKDTTNGNYYRIEIISGVVTATQIT